MSELASAQLKVPASGRLMSLDVFRGATIAGMMLVNNPGSWSHAYAPLLHAPWHGWTFTDVIFPFFLWIVGVAVPLSMCRRIEEGQARGELFVKVLRRAAILFALGMFLSSFGYLIDGSLFQGLGPWWEQYWNNVRIPGVLQRIGVCYFFAATIFLFTGIRGQLIWTGALLAGYWLLMALVAVPVEVGGQVQHVRGVFERDGNFAHYVDSLLLRGEGWNHMWGGRSWDPEGIVSTLPAIATTLFGILTGHMLRWRRSPEERTVWMFTAGSVLMWAGLVMNWWLPINKNLWTSSYAVFMAGMAMVIFALCYWVIDVKGMYQKWAKPAAIYGMNAITVFVLAGLLGRLSLEIKVPGATDKPVALKTWLFEYLFASFARGDDPLYSMKTASLLYALLYVLGLYAVAHVMYRRKWFVRF